MKDIDSYTRNFSPTMPSIYASDASELIKKASRNFMLTSILLISIFGFGILDIVNEMHLILVSDFIVDICNCEYLCIFDCSNILFSLSKFKIKENF